MPRVDLWRDCPGFAEAARQEDELRSLPFLGLPERVAGVDCAPLTLRRLHWLQLAASPFLGNYPVEALCEHPQIKYHLKLFFWTCSPRFKPGAVWRQKRFVKRISKIIGHDLPAIITAVKKYMHDAWLDANDGEKSRSFFSTAAGVTGFFHRAYGLDVDSWNDSWLRHLARQITGKPNPLDIPLRIVWQLQRVHQASKADTIFKNKLSDPTWETWLRGMNKTRN